LDNEAVSAHAGVSGRAPLAEPPSPQRYKVQFTAGEEYVKLVEEAKALLSHSVPRATLDEIQLRAMRALVAELKRRKHAVVAPPQKPPAESKDAGRSTARVRIRAPAFRRRVRAVSSGVRVSAPAR
jgi:hypothetical protein